MEILETDKVLADPPPANDESSHALQKVYGALQDRHSRISLVEFMGLPTILLIADVEAQARSEMAPGGSEESPGTSQVSFARSRNDRERGLWYGLSAEVI
jgi:hypothetical protein